MGSLIMQNNTATKLDECSPSVQAHLSILQSVIQRMATNSASCKTWCITVVSAILVVIADKNKPEYAFIAFLPTFLFMALDAYYLALEKGFRTAYNNFVQTVHSGNLKVSDLYSVAPAGSTNTHQLDAVKSPSVWGFYIPLMALILLAYSLVLK